MTSKNNSCITGNNLTSSKACVRCKKRKGTINIPSLELKACNQCFSEIIEKRFNKNMRINYPELTSINITLKRPSDKILHYLLKKREKKSRNLTVTTGKKSNLPQHTLDDIAVSVIKSFINARNEIIEENGPLSDTSENELSTYAKINNIEYKENKRTPSDKKIHELIQKLNQRRPGVMNSIKRFRDKVYA